jgi:hypothetical protein
MNAGIITCSMQHTLHPQSFPNTHNNPLTSPKAVQSVRLMQVR